MLDFDLQSVKLLDLKELSGDTGWGGVPMPIF
jgi:hypothetical protein